MVTLILGGARSGKSAYAERLAAELGGEAVLYVATAQALDEEMQARIDRHRAERSAGWSTVEAPKQVGAAIGRFLASADASPSVVLIDCLTVLVSNVLLAFDDPFDPAVENALNAELDALVRCMQTTMPQYVKHFIIVSNEVGLGLVPPYALGRAYRDLLGRANQRLAQLADRVLFMVAGLPMGVKEMRAGENE
ncbi:MAG: bifunctional adenosylcobinamide kinase/adenosylcobinamide-phosphate guanylyltransferase [Caldilineaceae bacterium]